MSGAERINMGFIVHSYFGLNDCSYQTKLDVTLKKKWFSRNV